MTDRNEVTRVSVSSETKMRDGKPLFVVRIIQDVVSFPLVKGITGHFALRVSDWFLSAMLLNLGFLFAGPNNVLANPVFAGLIRIAPEHIWAVFCITVACIRLFALTINGTYPAFRWSPHIRAFSAILTCICWFNISLGFWLAEIPTTGIAIYPWILIFDIYNVYLAASEAGSVERRRSRNAAGGDGIH